MSSHQTNTVYSKENIESTNANTKDVDGNTNADKKLTKENGENANINNANTKKVDENTNVDNANVKAKEITKVDQIFQNYETYSYIYSSLVEKVLQYDLLVKYIENKVKNDPSLINLIKKDWSLILKNNPTFQQYVNGTVQFRKYEGKTKALYNYKVPGHSNNINVIVIGTFKLVSKEDDNTVKLKLVDCPPVQCIADVMCLSLEKTVFHNAPFFINSCRGFCRICKEYKETSDNGWCLQSCMVYYNKKIQFATRTFCENLYRNPTKVILHLEISSAYSFGLNCKIGGNVKSVIFIDDIFNDVEINNIKGVLKMDTNYVPEDENETGKDANPSAEETNQKENEKDIKRPAEETNDSEAKRLKCSSETILGIPKGLKYEKPAEKKFDIVENTVKNMP